MMLYHPGTDEITDTCGNIDCSGTASGTYFCKDIYGQDFSVLYLIYILKSDVSFDSLYEEK